MSIKFKIVTPDIPSKGIFGSFVEILDRKKRVVSETIKDLLLEYARHGHLSSDGKHYRPRSGNLQSATKVKGGIETEITLYVDTSEAQYAGYIMEGKRKSPRSGTVTFNGGKGDPFLQEALDYHAVTIAKLVEDMWNEAILEWNIS